MGEPMRTALVAAVIAAGILAAAPVRANPEAASCAVRVIHAQACKAPSFDPALAPLRPQLTRAPFSAYPCLRLLQQPELQLTAGQPGTFTLPGDHSGALTYEGKVPGAGSAGTKDRLRFKLELRDGPAKLMATTIVINNAGTVLQAGMQHEGGILVLGITCHH